jgi:hypothetical protein
MLVSCELGGVWVGWLGALARGVVGGEGRDCNDHVEVVKKRKAARFK